MNTEETVKRARWCKPPITRRPSHRPRRSPSGARAALRGPGIERLEPAMHRRGALLEQLARAEHLLAMHCMLHEPRRAGARLHQPRIAGIDEVGDQAPLADDGRAAHPVAPVDLEVLSA